MKTEHNKLERAMAIGITFCFIGYLSFPEGLINRISEGLLIASAGLYMLSKTIRFWKLVDNTIKLLWVFAILVFIAGELLPVWLHDKTWQLLSLAALLIFSLSVNRAYQQLLREEEETTLLLDKE